MSNIDIRKYLKDETMQARIEYKVAELGLSERVDSVADEIASDYDAGKMQDTDPFGFPRNEREPHVVALDELIFNIQSMARQEYFKQMSKDDALTIVRGLLRPPKRQGRKLDCAGKHRWRRANGPQLVFDCLQQ